MSNAYAAVCVDCGHILAKADQKCSDCGGTKRSDPVRVEIMALRLLNVIAESLVKIAQCVGPQ